jgi:hypothetical protein
MFEEEEQHVALPRLVGAPAYARPPQLVTPTALPLDPDDLPIAAEQTPEEQAIAERLLANPFGVTEPPPAAPPDPQPRAKAPILNVIAERLLGRAS